MSQSPTSPWTSRPHSGPVEKREGFVPVSDTEKLGALWAAAESVEVTGLRVVDPGGSLHDAQSLQISRGRVQEAAVGFEPQLRLSFQKAVLVPGLSDMHVHLREPGGEESETVATGVAAAARGGFTRVQCMPNTTPPIDQRAVVELVLARAREAGGGRVIPVGGITKGLTSEDLTEMGELRRAGCLAVSNDGFPVPNGRVMRRAMEYAKTFDLLVISHSEDRDLKGDGVMNEGYWSTVLGLSGIPAAAEEVAVARDIALARLTGSRLHIAHVSTAGSVELVRRAKNEGLPVTAETAPHYFTLTDASLQTYDANYKMNPPLRTEVDVEAVLQGLADGTIDVIATDHAPHAPETKEVELDQAPFGIIGLETSLALVMTHLLMPGRLGLEDLVRLMSRRAAEIMGWGGGGVRVGEPADFTVIDPNRTWVVDAGEFASRSRNTPFNGMELQGRAVATAAEGRLIHWEAAQASATEELLARVS